MIEEEEEEEGGGGGGEREVEFFEGRASVWVCVIRSSGERSGARI